MFTGLVDRVGTVARLTRTAAGVELTIACDYRDVAQGESIAVNGACLTVREAGVGTITVAAIDTTLARTTIGQWQEGRRVNLERAARVGDRLGGHIVQGHVDGVGRVERVARKGTALLIDIDVGREIAEVSVPHGSIAIDGVSLTVNALPSPMTVQVAIIEYTERHTTLGSLRSGDAVHVEADVVGKYVQKLLAGRLPPV